jgi:hypothetical protein
VNEFSRAFIAAYERMPQWRRDQFDASMREFVAGLKQMAELLDRVIVEVGEDVVAAAEAICEEGA